MVSDAVLRAGERRTLPGPAPTRAAQDFHRGMPGYAPTPLLDLPELAPRLGCGRLLLKDESWRLGLPAFKIAGASWATSRALEAWLGRDPAAPPLDLATLARALAAAGGGDGPVLVAATDGNHGRAVARMAATLGLPALIFVPGDMVAARRTAIASEGAEVRVVDGSYDDAVATSAAQAGARHVVVSDTAWPGYERVPLAVTEGYSTILWEIDDSLGDDDGPDGVFVPVGVGAFAAAVAAHFRRPGLSRLPALVAVEPVRAACVLASMRAGARVVLEGAQDSIMAGLNCGTPSPLAWPILSEAYDLFVAIEDDVARDGMRLLATAGHAVGECAGGSVGAVGEVLGSKWAREVGLGPDCTVLSFLTEGATDPVAYEAVVGRPPEAVTGG